VASFSSEPFVLGTQIKKGVHVCKGRETFREKVYKWREKGSVKGVAEVREHFLGFIKLNLANAQNITDKIGRLIGCRSEWVC